MCILVCASLCVWHNIKAQGGLIWVVRNLPSDGKDNCNYSGNNMSKTQCHLSLNMYNKVLCLKY